MKEDENKTREIVWNAPEYVFYQKTVDWYWWFGIIVILLIGMSIYLGNILFIFVIIIGSFSLLLYTVRPPKMVSYSASTRGLSVNGRLYPYQTINSFFIDDQRGHGAEKLLLLELKKMTEPLLVIPIENTDVDKLRVFLLDFITEKEVMRPIGQTIMELLGL